MGDDVKPDDPVLGYRLHQWQKSDNGVVGMSSADRGARERRR